MQSCRKTCAISFLWVPFFAFLPITASAQYGAPRGEWPSYGGDVASTKYSALDQINKDNVSDLDLAWSWTTVDTAIHALHPRLARATYFQCTPLMVEGVLYGSTSLGQVYAIDAVSGETIWVYDTKSYQAGRPPNIGYVSRGVAYWGDADAGRILYATADSWLIALDAKTGKPTADFGEDGRCDLTLGIRSAAHGSNYGHSSAPIVVRETIVVGSSIRDYSALKEGIPGTVLGYDVRTGRRKWRFNTIPQAGEFGVHTWQASSWEYSGAANAWAPLSADEELGYVYVPTSTPTNDFYGGHRLGDNLFAESLVCLNAESGQRIWHFQIVHHGLWDYDIPAAPNLVDINVDGRTIKAVAQVTKHGSVFVFDRLTGKPVWPIEERPVASSDVPGERTSPTQPFPTRPAPFAKQGVSEDDVIDFTPELRAEALEILKNYRIGPLFTPPGLDKPLIMRPSVGGGANWLGAAVDPETGIIYIPSMNTSSVLFLTQPDPARSNMRYVRGRAALQGPRGLPLWKPPYGQISAIDLNTGQFVWTAVNGGDGPIDHPALEHLDLAPLGTNGRAGVMITRTLAFVTDGSGRSRSATGGGNRIRAFDKATGAVLWSFELPAQATGVPMTYMAGGKQYLVVPVGSSPAQFVALSLPK